MIEGDRVRQVAANAAAHVATDLQAKLAAAQAEYGFKLGVALEALRHVGHVLRGGFRAPEVDVAPPFLILLAKLMPRSEERLLGKDCFRTFISCLCPYTLKK